jgi:mono/diheme cytochrome c family protein
MRISIVFAFSLVLQAGDPKNGRLILQDQGCMECHTVNEVGISHENIQHAPDLGNKLVSTYTPTALASALWNHTPAMWVGISGKSGERPHLTEAACEDLFAYLYSVQFFERPAEVRRGKEVLESKRCLQCHEQGGIAPPADKWTNVDDPFLLVYKMWNHAPLMAQKLTERKKDWVHMSARDFMDLTAYAQYLNKEAPNRELSMPPPVEGKALFDSNCAGCHTGALELGGRLRNKTWMDIGSGMWNHAPAMLAVPTVPSADLRKILSYVWQLQYEGLPGDVEQGHQIFNTKRCVACHKDSAGTPKSPRPGRSFTGFSMVALGWGQARQMHNQMQAKEIAWPLLSPRDMNNLVAYLNSISTPGR